MKQIENLVGKRFGRLVVFEMGPRNKQNKIQWLCKCDCGKTTLVCGAKLKNGHTKSCGCLREQNTGKMFTKHNKSMSTIYHVYYGIKGRCYNPKNSVYRYYGGKGVTMCEDWRNDFMAFYNWAIANGYKDGLTIDRINSNGNYEPSNCRWVTQKEQNRNKKSNRFELFAGKKRCVAEIAELVGLSYSSVLERCNNNTLYKLEQKYLGDI